MSSKEEERVGRNVKEVPDKKKKATVLTSEGTDAFTKRKKEDFKDEKGNFVDPY
jgi:hypothetical protein